MIQRDAVPRIEAQGSRAGHETCAKLVGRVEEAAIGLVRRDMIGFCAQRLLQQRLGLGLRRLALGPTEPDHLHAAHQQCGKRDLNVCVVGVLGERLLQHCLRGLEPFRRGLVDVGGGLFDHDLALRGGWRVGIQQFVDAQRQGVTDARREPGLLHLQVGIRRVDRVRRGPLDLAGCRVGHARSYRPGLLALL